MDASRLARGASQTMASQAQAPQVTDTDHVVPRWRDKLRSDTRIGRGLRLAAILALGTTVYDVGGFFMRSGIDLREVVNVIVTWSFQFAVAGAMLWVIDRGFQRGGRGAMTHWRSIVVTVLVCTVIAWALHMGLGFVRVRLYNQWSLQEFLTGRIPIFMVLWDLSLASMLVLAYATVTRSQAAAETLHGVQLSQLNLEREIAAARLQLLQAQVEPHFIFNALANVRRLLRTDTVAARSLLTDLLRYLEEALPALRAEHSTLGQEVELVRAFLAVHQVRMGARLQVEVDVPASLASMPVPPMVLLTLVENALKHGLQPEVEGGMVRVQAHVEGGRVALTVADTGRGMGSGSGQGTGLANLRARLHSMYGDTASLKLALNEPRGVVATVSLPAAS